MHILVTNDDGVHAPGLLALIKAVRPLGKVSIVAPDKNWSAAGHVKTMDRPLRIKKVKLADGSEAYASDGAPSDCVALALLGFIDVKVDLVISGINPTANLGHDVTYSGTVTAAMEAAIHGVRGIAISLESHGMAQAEADYHYAASVAANVVKMVMVHHLPADTLLNVNIPYIQDGDFKGYRFTRQGMRIYRDELIERMDPRGQSYFWIGGDAPTGVEENGTDIGSLADGYVSITPIQLDLTDYKLLESMRGWHIG